MKFLGCTSIKVPIRRQKITSIHKTAFAHGMLCFEIKLKRHETEPDKSSSE